MWRSIASNGLSLLIVVLIAAAGVIGWGQAQYTADGPLEAAICLQVDRGSTMAGVAENLEERGAVSQAWIFRAGADYQDKSAQLKAGSWLLPEGASMENIADIITRGGASSCGTEVVYRVGVVRMTIQVRQLDPATNRFVELIAFNPQNDPDPQAVLLYEEARDQQDTRFRVAVAEGVTSWQVVQALNAVDVMTGRVPDVPPEGMLAPDSYEVAQGDDRGELLDQMEARQEERLATAWRERAENLPYDTMEEALTMASIIEKETGNAEERSLVAAVFVNRLREGWRLQTDPTVIYGVTEGRGVLDRPIRQSDLRARNQYNTYVVYGLPPTPIANPGQASIEAAVNPDTTEYMFFVAKSLDPSDGHLFAVTNEEHEANVAKYRQLEAEAAANGQ